jgi:hypothetical protein
MFQNANHTAELPAKPTAQQQPCLGGQEREQCEVNCRARVLEDELQWKFVRAGRVHTAVWRG